VNSDNSNNAINENAKSCELSIVIPAHNEQANIGGCIDDLLELLIDQHKIDVELIVVNDNSRDDTEAEVLKRRERWPSIRLVRRQAPGGFGRAIRTGLDFARGEVVIIYMGDRSDHPQDALLYFQTIGQGFDCVYGSRFVLGSVVHRYPRLKLVVNRIVNKAVQWMFWTEFNDLTNAFKAYRRNVVEHCGPYRACHFNITLEMSLSALIAGFKIAQVPIHWEGRTWGSSNLRMREMGRRYLCTLLMLFFQRMLMNDDVKAEGKRDMISGIEVY
jgi:dolichol-phosphate mannosyltransferase